MAKKIKYPKKFRMKLEKMAEARDARAADMTADQAMDRMTATLNRDFLPKNSVHFMHGKIDEQHRRLSMHYDMRPRPQKQYVSARPPWEPVDPENSAS